MSVSETALTFKDFITDGVVMGFPLTGLAFEQVDDVAVTFTPTGGVAALQTYGSHYSFTGTILTGAATLQRNGLPWAAGALRVERTTPFRQQLSASGTNSFTSPMVERALDDLARAGRDVRRDVADQEVRVASLEAEFEDFEVDVAATAASAAAAAVSEANADADRILAQAAAAQAVATSGLLDVPRMDGVTGLLLNTGFSYAAGPGLVQVFAGDHIRTRRENFVYEVAAAGAVDHHVVTAGGIKLKVLPNAGGSVSVLQFGVVMGGVVDDSAALQKALNHTSLTGIPLTMPAGTIAVSGDIYMWGKGSFKGKGLDHSFIELTALPAVPVLQETQRYWFVLGAVARGGVGQPFRGELTGICFNVPATLPEQLNTAVYLGAVDDGCDVHHIRVNTNGAVHNNGIGGKNNANIVAAPVRRNFTVRNCTVGNTLLADGEPIGFANAKSFHVNSCRVLGQAGDDVGFHACEDFWVKYLYMESHVGRVFLGDCKRWKVVKPIIKYVVDGVVGVPGSEGMGVVVQSESTIVPSFCDDGEIDSPTIVYGDSVGTPNYGMRLTGRNIRVKNPRLMKGNTVVEAARLVIENQSGPVIAPWVDPSGIDPAGTPRNHNVMIDGAQADEIVLTGTGSNVSIINSTARVFYMTGSSLEGFDNNKCTGTLTDSTFSGEAGQIHAAKKLFTRIAVGLTTNIAYTNALELPAQGQAGWRAPKNGVITHVVLSSTSLLTAGSVQYQFRKNGALMRAIGQSWVPADGQQFVKSFIQSAATKDYFFAAGDILTVQARLDAAGLPSPNDVIVEVHGLYL